MTPSSRDRLSVDLRGLKAALVSRAQALGVTPSDMVRTALAGALRSEGPASAAPAARPATGSTPGERVRMCVRMRRDQAQLAIDTARGSRLSLGDYLGGLVLAVPVLAKGGGRAEHVAELRASTAELATLSRNIHRLTALLRQADVEAARPYREALTRADADIRHHLELAARTLAELQPDRQAKDRSLT